MRPTGKSPLIRDPRVMLAAAGERKRNRARMNDAGTNESVEAGWPFITSRKPERPGSFGRAPALRQIRDGIVSALLPAPCRGYRTHSGLCGELSTTGRTRFNRAGVAETTRQTLQMNGERALDRTRPV